jgi:hypothetical protein
MKNSDKKLVGRPLTNRLKRSQSGMSFIGLLIVAGFCIAVAVVGMKVVPTAIEFNAIKRAIVKVANEGGDVPAEIRRRFDAVSAVDDISSIKGSDLEITKVNGQVVVSFKYEKRIPLAGPASLVIDYEGSSRK